MLALPLFVGALEVFDPALVEVPEAGGYLVDEVVVAGDYRDRSLIALEGDVEGIDGFEVEAVGGLVSFPSRSAGLPVVYNGRESRRSRSAHPRQMPAPCSRARTGPRLPGRDRRAAHRELKVQVQP